VLLSFKSTLFHSKSITTTSTTTKIRHPRLQNKLVENMKPFGVPVGLKRPDIYARTGACWMRTGYPKSVFDFVALTNRFLWHRFAILQACIDEDICVNF
jgi:hypothetical protein